MSDRLEEMKTDYKNIEVPDELKERLEVTIAKAKLENVAARRKRKIILFSARIGGTAAAAMLTITVLANSSATVAKAMEKVPVLGKITQVVTFRAYEDNKENTEAKIDSAKVEGLKDKDEEAKLNKSIEEYTNMVIARYKEDVKKLGKKGHEAVTTSQTVLTDNDRWFSMKISTEVSQASTDVTQKFYTVNKQTGKIAELKDFFKKGSDYVGVISQNVIKQMQVQMNNTDYKNYFLPNEEDQELYDSGAVEAFKKIKADQNFYINNDGNLVIAFDKYEVAPGYMGTPEFVIPQKALADIIK